MPLSWACAATAASRAFEDVIPTPSARAAMTSDNRNVRRPLIRFIGIPSSGVVLAERVCDRRGDAAPPAEAPARAARCGQAVDYRWRRPVRQSETGTARL